MSDKAEGASIFTPGLPSDVSTWNDDSLTETGRMIRAIVRGWATDTRQACNRKPAAAAAAASDISPPAAAARPPAAAIAPYRTLEIWWPADNAKVSGVQQFKLVLKANDGAILEPSSYDATWSVDGAQANPMCDAQDPGGGCMYKMAICDVSSWNWRGQPTNRGPFVLSFEARTKVGGWVVNAMRTIFADARERERGSGWEREGSLLAVGEL